MKCLGLLFVNLFFLSVFCWVYCIEVQNYTLTESLNGGDVKAYLIGSCGKTTVPLWNPEQTTCVVQRAVLSPAPDVQCPLYSINPITGAKVYTGNTVPGPNGCQIDEIQTLCTGEEEFYASATEGDNVTAQLDCSGSYTEPPAKEECPVILSPPASMSSPKYYDAIECKDVIMPDPPLLEKCGTKIGTTSC